ncbi:MAG: MFS transporter [Candidatus Rokuibacteriota bacterium]|nr:MAG: MFS transporter [Candidatus Rokubacteria bacterium]
MTEESRRRLTLAATVLGSSMAFIDATVVIVALPTIEKDLALGLSGEQWIFLSYSLALAALYLPAGAVGDRRGRRGTFLVGVIGFAAASALAGAAPTGGVLIVARTLQGIAGAFMTTNSLALLREVYGHEAGHAVGLWTAFTSLATIGGPPAGGAIVEWVSWRWIFFLNLPMAGLTVVLTLRGRCAEREHVSVGRLDLPGAALAAAGFATLTFGIVDGANHGFGDSWWAFVIAVVCLVAFVVVEHRSEEPLLPLSLFRSRNFTASNVETLLVYGSLGGMSFFLTIYLQFLGFSPLGAGLASIPAGLVLILLSTRLGRFADEHGPRLPLTLGPLLLGGGMLLFVLVKQRSDFWTFGVAGLTLFALGLAAVVAPITATALSSAPQELSGIASGVNVTLSRLGNLLAVAVAGLVVLLVFQANGGSGKAVPLARGQHDPGLRSASVDAFHAAMLLTAGLALAGAAVAAVGVSNEEAKRAKEQREPLPAATA